MINKAKSRLDAFALALGGVSVKSPYVGIPVVANDRINTAWDERLGASPDERGPDVTPEGACAGWAT